MFHITYIILGQVGIVRRGYYTLLFGVSFLCKFVDIIVPSCSSHSLSLVESCFPLIFVIHMFLVSLISTLSLVLIILGLLLDIYFRMYILLLVQSLIAPHPRSLLFGLLHCFHFFCSFFLVRWLYRRLGRFQVFSNFFLVILH